MWEHEMLKVICDKIGYEVLFEYDSDNEYIRVIESLVVAVDVREIIFTQEFMERFISFTNPNPINNFYWELMKNLDNPILYLYNLIK